MSTTHHTISNPHSVPSTAFPHMFVLASTPLDAAHQDATLARELTHHAEQDAHEAVAEWSAAKGARRRELGRVARGCIGKYRACERRYRSAALRLMVLQVERQMMRNGVQHLFDERAA